MKKERRTTIVAISVAALIAVLPFTWYSVLNNVAVYRSISLTPGTTVTQDFWTNYNGVYTLGIQAERKIPHEQLQCLLGITDSLGPKNCSHSPLRYTWTMSCDGGKAKYSGTSDKIIGGAYANDWIETEFGAFEAKRWERCHLEINFTGGSEALSQAHPKLNVYVELF